MSLQWYTLRSKPNKEEALWRELSARGLEIFYPRLTVHPVNPRARTIRPYFPGYLFVHADLQVIGYSTLAWMPHSHGLVCFGPEPATAPDELIHALRQRIDHLNHTIMEPTHTLRHGEVVRIEGGPFAGYEGLFDEYLTGSERVRVLLKLLSRQQVPLVLPVGQIERVNSQTRFGQ